MMCVTHHQTQAHTCFLLLAIPCPALDVTAPRPARARASIQADWERGQQGLWGVAGHSFRTTGCCPNTRSTHGSGCRAPPREGQDPSWAPPPLQRRSLLTGPQGILEEITQPTQREGEGLVSIAVPPTPWVDCLQLEPEPWEDTKALPSPPLFRRPPADLATFLCFKP